MQEHNSIAPSSVTMTLSQSHPVQQRSSAPETVDTGVVIRRKKNLSLTTERPWSFSDFLTSMSSALTNAGKKMTKMSPETAVSPSLDSNDDENDDDDVFYSSDLITVMQKSKSASSGGRLNPKKIWRARSKSQPRNSGSAAACLWTPQVSDQYFPLMLSGLAILKTASYC